MIDSVLWKPLYYASIGIFIFALVMLPFSPQFSVILSLFLVSIWSRIPGFVHFVFNKLALNDLFTFIVAAHAGPVAGALFGGGSMIFSRCFGPNEWLPYTIRATIAVSLAALLVPLIVSITGGTGLFAFIVFEIVMYVIYYALVLFIWTEEIHLELVLLPVVIFFDFFMNGIIMQRFDGFFAELMTKGFTSGWPIMFFVGLTIGFLLLSRNADKIPGLSKMAGK